MIFLHGQFGDPSDSSEIFKTQKNLYSFPIYDFQIQNRGSNLWDMAKGMGREIQRLGFLGQGLVGYSYGGRLALHLILKFPKLFKWAVLVGSHPGLATRCEQIERLSWDSSWADKINQAQSPNDWEKLESQWNSLEVFRDSVTRKMSFPKTIELKNALSETFRLQGLGSQQFLLPRLHAVQIPVLWVTGEKEKSLGELHTKLLNQNKLFYQARLTGAGHRVPWDKNKEFNELIYDFSARLGRD